VAQTPVTVLFHANFDISVPLVKLHFFEFWSDGRDGIAKF